MSEDRDIQNLMREEKRAEPAGKYKPLPRNKKTEREISRIFEHGTEAELTSFLRACGL